MWNVFPSSYLLKNLSSLCSFNYTWWLILVEPQRIFLHTKPKMKKETEETSVIMGLGFFSNPSLTFPFEKLDLSTYSIKSFVILYRGSKKVFQPPIFNTRGVGWKMCFKMWHHADNVNLDLMGWFLRRALLKNEFQTCFVKSSNEKYSNLAHE